MHSFFEVIAGMTKNVRFDNLSSVVSKIFPDHRQIYTKNFNRAIAYYGFGLFPCSLWKRKRKG